MNGKHSVRGDSVLAYACNQSCSYGGDGGGESGEEELEIVRCLLENGADPNVESDDKSSLREACYSGTGRLENRLDIIKLLVETGAYDELIETPYNRGYTPVFNTCGFGKWALDCFQYFTEKFPNLLKNEEYRNLYLIHAAAEKQFALMEALLDAGADINAVDKHGKSPLLAFALSYGAPIGHPFPKESASIDCMRYLIEKGADIFQREEVNGHNLLHAFLRSMPSETERRIEDGYDTPDKSLEFFKELLEKGIPWEEERRGGRTVNDMHDLIFEMGHTNEILSCPEWTEWWAVDENGLHLEYAPGYEPVKEVCGTPALERKIFLHRNGQTYGPYSRSSVERFLLENLASPNDWARFKESGEWTRLKDLLEE